MGAHQSQWGLWHQEWSALTGTPSGRWTRSDFWFFTLPRRPQGAHFVPSFRDGSNVDETVVSAKCSAQLLLGRHQCPELRLERVGRQQGRHGGEQATGLWLLLLFLQQVCGIDLSSDCHRCVLRFAQGVGCSRYECLSRGKVWQGHHQKRGPYGKNSCRILQIWCKKRRLKRLDFGSGRTTRRANWIQWRRLGNLARQLRTIP